MHFSFLLSNQIESMEILINRFVMFYFDIFQLLCARTTNSIRLVATHVHRLAAILAMTQSHSALRPPVWRDASVHQAQSLTVGIYRLSLLYGISITMLSTYQSL